MDSSEAGAEMFRMPANKTLSDAGRGDDRRHLPTQAGPQAAEERAAERPEFSAQHPPSSAEHSKRALEKVRDLAEASSG